MNAHYWWCYPQWVIDGVVLPNISYQQCCLSWPPAIDSIVYHERRLVTVNVVHHKPTAVDSIVYHGYKLATVLSIPNTSYRQHWWYTLSTANTNHRTMNTTHQQHYPPATWVLNSAVHHDHELSTVLSTPNTCYWWHYPSWTQVIDSIVYHEHEL